MDTKGGRYSMTVGGRTMAGRATAKISPSGISRDNGVNGDGSGYSTVKPKLISLELSFDRGKGFRWDTAMMLEDVDVTFVEDDLSPKVTHLLTRANWGGEPSIDSESGEVSGCMLQCDDRSYRQI